MNEYYHKTSRIIDELNIYASPYINLLKTNNIKLPFKRGVNQSTDALYVVKDTQMNRKPRGTPPGMFKHLNIWLKANKHNNRDEHIVMCSSSNAIVLTIFGDVFYVFPYGNVNYTFIRAYDLNLSDKTYNDMRRLLTDYDMATNNIERANISSELNTYFDTNKNIKAAYTNEFEIWFKCNKYGLLKIDTVLCDDILESIGLHS